MMPSRARNALFACVVTGLAACGTLSTEGDRSAQPPPADDGAPGSEGGAPEAGFDAPPPGPFCGDAGAHDLCDDFDNGLGAGVGWTPGPELGDNDKVPPHVVTDALSGTGSMESVLVRQDAIFHAAVLHQRDQEKHKTANPVHIELDFKVVQTDDGQYRVFFLQLVAPYFGLEVVPSGTSGDLAVYAWRQIAGAPGGKLLTLTAHKDQWMHLVLDIPPRSVETVVPITIKLGSEPAVVVDDVEADPQATSFDVQVGITSGTVGGNWIVRYDNVILDWR